MKKTIYTKAVSLFAAALFMLGSTGASAEEASPLREANDMRNIAAGKPYTIETGEPVGDSYGNYMTDFYGNDMGQLTDGNMAKLDSNDNGWYRAMRGGSRIVTVDLGEIYAVSRVEASFLQSKAEAFYAPRSIRVSLSENGNDFMTVALKTENDLHGSVKRRVNRVIELEETYGARYVRVEYSVDIFAACDEIRVLGDVGGERVTLTPDGQAELPEMSTDIMGASSFIKLYNGYYADQSLADLTAEKIKPYIAYIDENGNIADTMFDGVILVPCHTDYPSGGRLTKTNGKKGAVMSDWMLYADHTFDASKDLSALDKTVGEVYAATGKDGRMPVMLTMPYPTVLEGAFGDIDGDGNDEYCRTLDERLSIIKWFADLCVKRFNDAEYKNITLAGFYWYREEVNYSDTDHEAEMCIKANEYFHSLSLESIFDPFYLSTGYDHYRELGFDACVMQPNYAEISSDREYFRQGMLSEFAVTVKNNGCGVEIETLSPYAYTDGADYRNAAKNYLEYLYEGVKSGYADNLKTWYQGAGPGSIYSFCHADTSTSRGKLLRGLYDATYEFIKGTLSAGSITVSGDTEVSGEAGTRIRGDYTVSGGISELLEYTVSSKPANGDVDAYMNGYKYVPNSGFVGEDEFEITVSDGFSESAVIKVRVTVTASDGISGDIQPEGSDTSAPEQDEGKPLPVLPFVVAGVMVAAAAVFCVIKKRNKNKK